VRPLTQVNQIALVVAIWMPRAAVLGDAWRRTVESVHLRPPARPRHDLSRQGAGLPRAARAAADGAAEAERQGFTVLQSGRGYGRFGDGGFAYFDTEASLGVILELIEVLRERVPPEAEYPPR
jgi:hypothetical protein